MPQNAIFATVAPDALDAAGLTRLIVERYHRDHLEDLGEAVAMAQALEAAHAGLPDWPRGLRRVLDSIRRHLEVHQRMEARVLFPLLLRSSAEGAWAPLAGVRQDHDDLRARLRDLARMTGDFVTPDDASDAWRALYRLVSKFHAGLLQHIGLETEVLFPRFAPELAPAQRSAA